MSNAMLIAADLDAMFPDGFHSHAYQNHAATVKTAAQILREQDRQIETLRSTLQNLANASKHGLVRTAERYAQEAAAVLEQTAR